MKREWKERNQQQSAIIDTIHMRNLGWTDRQDSETKSRRTSSNRGKGERKSSARGSSSRRKHGKGRTSAKADAANIDRAQTFDLVQSKSAE